MHVSSGNLIEAKCEQSKIENKYLFFSVNLNKDNVIMFRGLNEV